MKKNFKQNDLVYITKTIDFSAGHFCYIDELNQQENEALFGKSSRKTSHGHNYTLSVTLKGFPDKQTGMIINLLFLKDILQKKIISNFDHKNLNIDVPYFKEKQPTSENISIVIWKILESELKDKLYKVTLQEDEDLCYYYKGESFMVYLTRIYKFSASHRLNNINLSEEENSNIFGKCNNYNFHGHNYKLEVTLKGDIDPVTGMVYNILDLDKIVDKTILNDFDYMNLNEDVTELKNTITSGENLIKFIWHRLNNSIDRDKLYKLRLYETDRNYFEYYGN